MVKWRGAETGFGLSSLLPGYQIVFEAQVFLPFPVHTPLCLMSVTCKPCFRPLDARMLLEIEFDLAQL